MLAAVARSLGMACDGSCGLHRAWLLPEVLASARCLGGALRAEGSSRPLVRAWHADHGVKGARAETQRDPVPTRCPRDDEPDRRRPPLSWSAGYRRRHGDAVHPRILVRFAEGSVSSGYKPLSFGPTTCCRRPKAAPARRRGHAMGPRRRRAFVAGGEQRWDGSLPLLPKMSLTVGGTRST
jgi:hypothetical protein